MKTFKKLCLVGLVAGTIGMSVSFSNLYSLNAKQNQFKQDCPIIVEESIVSGNIRVKREEINSLEGDHQIYKDGRRQPINHGFWGDTQNQDFLHSYDSLREQYVTKYNVELEDLIKKRDLIRSNSDYKKEMDKWNSLYDQAMRSALYPAPFAALAVLSLVGLISSYSNKKKESELN